jgi:hypothetical protein
MEEVLWFQWTKKLVKVKKNLLFDRQAAVGALEFCEPIYRRLNLNIYHQNHL